MARGKKSPQKKTPAASPARADAVAAAAAAASQAAAALGMAAQPTAESVESALAAGCAALAAGAFEAAAEALRCGLRAAKGLAKEASPAAARVHEARLALARTEAARGCPAAARKAYKSALTRYFPTATLQSCAALVAADDMVAAATAARVWVVSLLQRAKAGADARERLVRAVGTLLDELLDAPSAAEPDADSEATALVLARCALQHVGIVDAVAFDAAVLSEAADALGYRRAALREAECWRGRAASLTSSTQQWRLRARAIQRALVREDAVRVASWLTLLSLDTRLAAASDDDASKASVTAEDMEIVAEARATVRVARAALALDRALLQRLQTRLLPPLFARLAGAGELEAALALTLQRF